MAAYGSSALKAPSAKEFIDVLRLLREYIGHKQEPALHEALAVFALETVFEFMDREIFNLVSKYSEHCISEQPILSDCYVLQAFSSAFPVLSAIVERARKAEQDFKNGAQPAAEVSTFAL